jgi:hypothetical protein
MTAKGRPRKQRGLPQPAHEPPASTPKWVWVVLYLLLIGAAGIATSGRPPSGAPPGDVNCISGVQSMGCMP